MGIGLTKASSKLVRTSAASAATEAPARGSVPPRGTTSRLVRASAAAAGAKQGWCVVPPAPGGSACVGPPRAWLVCSEREKLPSISTNTGRWPTEVMEGWKDLVHM